MTLDAVHLTLHGNWISPEWENQGKLKSMTGQWNVFRDGNLVTTDTVANTLYLEVERDHVIFRADSVKIIDQVDCFIKAVKHILENITIKHAIRINFKGIPMDVMQAMNKNRHHPFKGYFDYVIKFRSEVIKRISNWGFDVTLDYIYTSALVTEYVMREHDWNYDWNPKLFNRVKPAGAMFAKTRKERLEILDSCLKVLDRSEFIYSISQLQVPAELKENQKDFKHYDWIRSGKEAGITFDRSTLHNSFKDPSIKENKAATGFNNPLPFYDQICLELVSETGTTCFRADVSEKLTRPMLYGMPFLTNPWYDYLLRNMGGQSYWDLLNIKIPKIQYVDHNLHQDDITLQYIHFTDVDRYYTDYNMSDLHPRLHLANIIMGIESFRRKCNDPGFVKQVKEVIEHNQKLIKNHNQKYDYVLEYYGRNIPSLSFNT